jgi:protein-tyrosine phosphatase
LPGVYNNTGPAIRQAVVRLRTKLLEAGIPVRLVTGADVHIAPDLAERLADGRALTLNDSRYLLLEPPHRTLPRRLDDLIFGLQAAGYVPILTHPERLDWVGDHYDVIKRLTFNSVLLQITAGSLLGEFGRRARYWAERMLDDGLCHFVATDAHDIKQRGPHLAQARELVAHRLGEDEATNLLLRRPQCVVKNVRPAELPALPPARLPERRPRAEGPSVWTNIVNRVRRMAGTG